MKLFEIDGKYLSTNFKRRTFKIALKGWKDNGVVLRYFRYTVSLYMFWGSCVPNFIKDRQKYRLIYGHSIFYFLIIVAQNNNTILFESNSIVYSKELNNIIFCSWLGYLTTSITTILQKHEFPFSALMSSDYTTLISLIPITSEGERDRYNGASLFQICITSFYRTVNSRPGVANQRNW